MKFKVGDKVRFKRRIELLFKEEDRNIYNIIKKNIDTVLEIERVYDRENLPYKLKGLELVWQEDELEYIPTSNPNNS